MELNLSVEWLPFLLCMRIFGPELAQRPATLAVVTWFSSFTQGKY